MSRSIQRRAVLNLALGACLAAACAAPIVPQRTKSGGAARWADALAQQRVLEWSRDAQLCDILGAGVGTDGWLPDRGGKWQLTYWCPEKPVVFQVSIDSDGNVHSTEWKDPVHRGHTIPSTWIDTPKIWAATRLHQKAEPVSTFEAELALGADAEHFPERVVWRIRFYMPGGGYETHVVSPDAKWLGSY